MKLLKFSAGVILLFVASILKPNNNDKNIYGFQTSRQLSEETSHDVYKNETVVTNDTISFGFSSPEEIIELAQQ